MALDDRLFDDVPERQLFPHDDLYSRQKLSRDEERSVTRNFVIVAISLSLLFLYQECNDKVEKLDFYRPEPISAVQHHVPAYRSS